MNTHVNLHDIAQFLVTPGKGILAADQSPGTINKQLEAVGADTDAETRRRYRQLLFTAPNLEKYVNGVILHDGTIRNHADDNTKFVDMLLAKGIVPIIKVDKSTVDHTNFPGEVVTQGLDNLEERLTEYYNLGARATKWRAVFRISETTPTEQNIVFDAMTLARYAALAQASGMVPIVEPEVLFSGNHSLEQAEAVTTQVLAKVFEVLDWYKVDLSSLLLKSSMVLAGSEYETPTSPAMVAEATLRTFKASVPDIVPGIVFLSGGQTPKRATENLQAIAQAEKADTLPWELAFSFSRGIEAPVQEAWQGNDANITTAQTALIDRLEANCQADRGEYHAA